MDPTAWKYYRASKRRVAAAELLLSQEDRSFNLDGVYLAGYAAECILKALIIEATPISKREALIEEIGRGAKAHDFDSLKYRYRVPCRQMITRDVQDALVRIASMWTTDLRYDSKLIESADAEAMRSAVRVVLAWAENKLR